MDGGFWQAGKLHAEKTRDRLFYYRVVFPSVMLGLLVPLLMQLADPYMTVFDLLGMPALLGSFLLLTVMAWLRAPLRIIEPLLLGGVNLFLMLRLAFTLAAGQVSSPTAELGATLPWMILMLFATAWIWPGRAGTLLNVGVVFAMALCVLAWWPSGRPSPERQLLSSTLIQLLLASATVVTGQLMVMRLYAAQRLQTRQAMREATLDSLTTLPNRRALTHRLEQQAGRAGGLLALALIDVDHFKAVNDQYGHARGDDVLKSVALSLRGQLGLRGLVGRHGGEEFLCILDAQDEQDARQICEGLRARVAALPMHGVAVTVSIGLALCEAPVHSLALMEAADAAMYRAKAQGRNRVQITVMLNPNAGPLPAPALTETGWRADQSGSHLN